MSVFELAGPHHTEATLFHSEAVLVIVGHPYTEAHVTRGRTGTPGRSLLLTFLVDDGRGWGEERPWVSAWRRRKGHQWKDHQWKDGKVMDGTCRPGGHYILKYRVQMTPLQITSHTQHISYQFSTRWQNSTHLTHWFLKCDQMCLSFNKWRCLNIFVMYRQRGQLNWFSFTLSIYSESRDDWAPVYLIYWQLLTDVIFWYPIVTLITAWISNYIHHKVWDEITYRLQTSTFTPLKFWNGEVISSHTVLDISLLIHAGSQVNPC